MVDGGPVVVPWRPVGVKMALRVFPVAVHAADGVVLMHFWGPAVESHGPSPHHLLLESFPVTREGCILEELWPLAQRFGSCSFPMWDLASSALLHIGLH